MRTKEPFILNDMAFTDPLKMVTQFAHTTLHKRIFLFSTLKIYKNSFVQSPESC